MVTLYSDLEAAARAVEPLAEAFADREAHRGTPAWDGCYRRFLEDVLSRECLYFGVDAPRSGGRS